MAQKPKSDRDATTVADKNAAPTIRWDDSKMRSTYANVCNVSSTREEMTLLFGTNQTWHSEQPQLTIELTDRIIINPFAAKRMSRLLNKVVAEYESRYGPLDKDAATADENKAN